MNPPPHSALIYQIARPTYNAGNHYRSLNSMSIKDSSALNVGEIN